MSLFKIGKGKACNKLKIFEILFDNNETRTEDQYVDKITRLDTVVPKTYSGGCSFILSWYRNKINP